jgi:hypothetical protein
VPHGFRLRLELTGQDGSVRRSELAPEGGETDLRLASLLDFIGRNPNPEIRDVIFDRVGASLLAAHRDAMQATIALEAITLPTLAEFRAGGQRRYDFTYGYEFRRTGGAAGLDD